MANSRNPNWDPLFSDKFLSISNENQFQVQGIKEFSESPEKIPEFMQKTVWDDYKVWMKELISSLCDWAKANNISDYVDEGQEHFNKNFIEYNGQDLGINKMPR